MTFRIRWSDLLAKFFMPFVPGYTRLIRSYRILQLFLLPTESTQAVEVDLIPFIPALKFFQSSLHTTWHGIGNGYRIADSCLKHPVAN